MIPDEPLNWTDPIIGIVLMNAVHDSEGKPIDPAKYYHVAKNPDNGKIIIIESNKNDQNHD